MATLNTWETGSPASSEGAIGWRARLFALPATPRLPRVRAVRLLKQYLVALATFGTTTALNLELQHWLGYQAIALVYLLAIVILALLVSRGPILFGTALMALSWSYAFAPPAFVLQIASTYDRMMFAMYFIVALIVGELTARLRAEQQAEQKREQHAVALYLLTRELADAPDLPSILDKIVDQVGGVFEAQVAVLLAAPDKPETLEPYLAATWNQSETEGSLSHWVYKNNRPAGRGTRIYPMADGAHFPLTPHKAPIGVLALKFQGAASFSTEQRSLLEHFVAQIALVLDCQRLRDSQVNTKLLAESERLSRTLLNSVSHELRTPLAVITTAAHSLRVSGPISPIQNNLGAEIETAAARLNRVVQSLLNAARLQAGQVHPKLDWCDVSDLIRVTARRVRDSLAGHPLQMRLAPKLPLLKADFILLEQSVGNLLVNAANHTPPGATIEVEVRAANRRLIIQVLDKGPGIPADQLGRVFELFHRLPGSKPGGVGLGLAIVKGFVEAQGGTVQVANRPEGGAMFTISLPLVETPGLPEEPV